MVKLRLLELFFMDRNIKVNGRFKNKIFSIHSEVVAAPTVYFAYSNESAQKCRTVRFLSNKEVSNYSE